MPAIKTGYAVQCKVDDPQNRYQLVVRGQIANRVYVVKNTKYNKDFCMKVEPFNPLNELKQLRRDLNVMTDARKYPTTLGSHFLAMTNKGCVEDVFNYIVMPLGEGNIADLRKNIVCGDFCLETAVRLALESFQAINDLHSLSYVHRAIGPNKFVIGPDGKRLFLVGLSLSLCMYKDSKSTPKHIHHYGASRFQSCNWHRRREQFYRDDLESWLYMTLDLFGQKNLPWNVGMLDVQMLELKEEVLKGGFDSSLRSVPRQIKDILLKINECRESEKPDYRHFKEILLNIRKKVHCDMKGPYNMNPETKERELEVKDADTKKETKPKDSKTKRKDEKVQKEENEESPFLSDVPEKLEKADSKAKLKAVKEKEEKVRKKSKKALVNDVQMILEQAPFVTVEDLDVPKKNTSKQKSSRKEEKEDEDENDANEKFVDEPSVKKTRPAFKEEDCDKEDTGKAGNEEH
ncbi:hypothetical protein L596_016326 [Steinernema carpocapsae]|uniref:Protein kinase domain-containing protein n=1 Tax=Steinernema carpocapsae TaxID=34508 RepID=A0A4V6A3H3_STECR|nr:hypothetical protein L596_016326 [Steinernema carpocapsae]